MTDITCLCDGAERQPFVWTEGSLGRPMEASLRAKATMGMENVCMQSSSRSEKR